jgi:superfamily II DNA or RNA helicase
MQIPHSGDAVLVRRQRWRVVDVHRYEGCELVTLIGTGATNAGARRHFLMPFESVAGLPRPSAVRFVRPTRWRNACRALLSANCPPGALRTAGRARLDLWPHQLEPALAIVRGLGTRVLLADDVGLGKTIQAGLIVTELQAHGVADRVLVITPAGVREQWADELSRRFSIDAAVVDFRDIRRRTASLPVGLNPWTTIPVTVTSIDYVKRPEVLRAASACRWDVVIVDEAHGAASDSERHTAVSALAARAGYVILLTATPHSGDWRAFNALCETGRHDDPLLVFRRSRLSVKLGAARRIHRLQVRSSPAEAHMRALLREFAKTVEAERGAARVQLALSVLHKRALSSATSLGHSVARRLAALDTGQPDTPRQLALPLEDVEGELDLSDNPPPWPDDLALSDREKERRLLEALAAAASAAAARETKVEAVVRLLRRIAEPIVIFTEYRDTLLRLRDVLTARSASVLHGGLARNDRRAALEDFACGRTSVLLATDAAGEGLNLQERCRVVVNLELPWNPMRLEQRIGRVDRIGQRRTVHAFHLVARGSGEEQILERLQLRIARAQKDITISDPLSDERAAARFVGLDAANGPEDSRTVTERLVEAAANRLWIDLKDEAAAEVERIVFARKATNERVEASRRLLESAGTWITRARRHETRRHLRRNAVALLLVEWEDGHGRVRHSMLFPTAMHLERAWLPTRSELRAIVRGADRTLSAMADEEALRQHAEVDRWAVALVDARLARERAIALMRGGPHAPTQAGLFDRRAERELQADHAAAAEIEREIDERIHSLSYSRTLSRRPARLLLVLLP